jgi:circadian clock protein KaiC
MRLAQEAREEAEALSRQQEIQRRKRDLQRRRTALDAQIAAERAAFESEQDELKQIIAQAESATDRVRAGRDAMARKRRADRPEEGG